MVDEVHEDGDVEHGEEHRHVHGMVRDKDLGTLLVWVTDHPDRAQDEKAVQEGRHVHAQDDLVARIVDGFEVSWCDVSCSA